MVMADLVKRQIHHRGTEDTEQRKDGEKRQRAEFNSFSPLGLCPLCVLCVSVVNPLLCFYPTPSPFSSRSHGARYGRTSDRFASSSPGTDAVFQSHRSD